MKLNKYKIVFDSNIVFCNEENQLDKVFNSNIKGVFDFLKSNRITNVSLWMPQLVIDERIAQRIVQVEDEFKKMNSASNNLNIFGGLNIKEKSFKRQKFQKKLNENALKIIRKYKIKTIPTINVEQEIIVQRALQKIAPFCGRSKRGDKGFKDTLIWLSFLNDAKNNQSYNYILFTNDRTDFDQDICEKEFKENSSTDFWIIREPQSLKVFLDEKLKLDLELKKLYQEVEQEIFSLQGTITAEVGRYINENAPYSSSMVLLGYTSMLDKDKDSGNFNFHSLNINNISPEENNEFNITVDLCVTIKESKKDSSPGTITVYFKHEDIMVKYNVSLKYKRDTKHIEILSAIRDVSHCSSFLK